MLAQPSSAPQGRGPDPYIRFQDVDMAFGAVRIVHGLQLDIARSEFVSMLGPYGSGKTTILTMLAGFLTPTGGQIFVDGQRIDRLPPTGATWGWCSRTMRCSRICPWPRTSPFR